MPPLVSVIVPNYNHAPFLKQRLDSVFNQSFRDFEVILLDDKSTDNSVEILNEYARRPQVSHYVVNEQNSGSPFAQWKKGIHLARGEYIWIAESDDVAEVTFLETMTGFLNGKVGIAFCKPTKIDAGGLINKKPKEIEKSEFQLTLGFEKPGLEKIADGFLYKNLINNASTCIFKKSLAQPFPDQILNFKFAGDWYYWINLVQQTTIRFHATSLSYFRAHDNTSRSTKKSTTELIRLKEFNQCIKLGSEILTKNNISVKKQMYKYTWMYYALEKRKKALGVHYYFPPFSFNIVLYIYALRFKKLIGNSN